LGDYTGDLRLIRLGQGGFVEQLKQAEQEMEEQGKKNSEQTKSAAALQANQRENTRKALGAMNQVAPAVTGLLTEFSSYLDLAVDALASFVDYVVEAFSDTKPVETKAAEKFREQAFQGASYQQRYLGTDLTAEQKRADEIQRQGVRVQILERAIKDRQMFERSPQSFREGYKVESPDAALAEQKKLKQELAEIVKQMGLEDLRARREEARQRREANRKRGQEAREQAKNQLEGTAAPATALPPAGSKPVTVADLAARGLKFDSSGDVQRSDMGLSPKLIDLAEKVQNQIEGFRKFNGFNDRFHHTLGRGSDHTRGQAFDFALNYRPTKEQGQKIVSQLKSMGFYDARDEYNNPSEGSTGGHIHAAIKEFADGGILRARPGGEVVRAAENGYDEAFIPLKNGTVPVTINGLDIDREISAAMTRALDTQNTVYVDAMKNMVNDLRQTMTDAVSRMNNNNEVFGQLLASTQEMVRTQQQTNSLQTKMLQVVSN
jgi:hypothetical protein